MRKIFTTKAEPVIYFRMWKGIIMYIGETSDLKRGRPFRKGDTDCELSKSETEINTVLDKIGKRRFTHKHLENLDKSQKIRDNRYIGEYDKIITIKASKNSKRRQYWEAYFIVKYKPICMSNISRYVKMLKGKNYKVSEQEKEEILRKRDLRQPDW